MRREPCIDYLSLLIACGPADLKRIVTNLNLHNTIIARRPIDCSEHHSTCRLGTQMDRQPFGQLLSAFRANGQISAFRGGNQVRRLHV